ncbi:MAG: NUDIX domain-containing protein [bacterium]|nr:NUDIX domain-containing protein [bacterium]
MEKKIGVVVAPYIINNEGRVLLFKSVKWKGLIPPGGHVEYGETLVEALKRETKEETGLDIEPIKLINIGEMIEPKEFYEPRHFIYIHFLCKIKAGEVKLDKRELVDYEWVDPEAAIKRKDILAKDTLRKLVNAKKTTRS